MPIRTQAHWSVKPTDDGVALTIDDGQFPEILNLPADQAWQLTEDIRRFVPRRPSSANPKDK
ncbi:MAG: hypothetical protein E6Q98_02920 [Rhodospirillaceae bacterium]|nr:MAG: hypothetical protein E6Q98_02920 [Rhodospirillaceae bacterium]